MFVAGNKTASYCYDANGAMISGDGRTVAWSAFGMPTRIEKGLRRIDIAYGPDRARFKRVDANETGQTTTHYVAGGSYESVRPASGSVTNKVHVAGVALVIDREVTPGNVSVETRYLLADHLGSVDTVLDSAGAVLERLSFDPWGKRRQADWKAFMAGTGYLWQSSVYTRGYTGHEQLDPVDLVHMNGRVYDADLGRFLSTDPVIQDATNLQNLNPYSYVLNNPLSFTDPSGFFFSKLFKTIGNFFKKIFRAIGNVFKAILNSQIVRAIIQIAACAAVGPACAAVTAGITLLAGGSIAESIQAGIFSFISAGVWTAVGQVLTPLIQGLDLVSAIGVKGVVHGVVGGALSVAQGGSFTDGFVANAVGAGAGLLSSGTAIGSNIYTDTAAVALAGGLAAEVTGGKFANGAITAAFANIFNKWGGLAKATEAAAEQLTDLAQFFRFGPVPQLFAKNTPILPPGMSRGQFGRIMQWGKELEAKSWSERLANDPAFGEAITNSAEKSGISKEMLGNWSRWYGENYKNSGSEQFRYRSEGLRQLYDKLPGIGGTCLPPDCT